MVLDWLKKLSGGPTGKPRDNGTDRNAVIIKRVVAGAAEESKKSDAGKSDSGTTTAVADPPPAEPVKPTPTPPLAIVPVSLPRDKIAQRAFIIFFGDCRQFAQNIIQRGLHLGIGCVHLRDAFGAQHVLRQIDAAAALVFGDVA